MRELHTCRLTILSLKIPSNHRIHAAIPSMGQPMRLLPFSNNPRVISLIAFRLDPTKRVSPTDLEFHQRKIAA